MHGVLLGLIAPLLASASIVLTDGQVIRGTEVTRLGDAYIVKMDGGNAVSFPVVLVKEIRFEDDAPPANPYVGVYQTTPRTLAGPPPKNYASQDPKEQLAVFGPPTRWSDSAVDTTWTPTNAYDTTKDVLAGSRSTWAPNAVDTSWTPTSSYDLSKDVMAGSRSTWAPNVVDTTWVPTDSWGFKPLSAPDSAKKARYPMSFATPAPVDVPATASRPAEPNPWSCGEAIFAGASGLAVRPLKAPTYAALGLPLYVAEARVASTKFKAVFAIAGDACRLVGGDTDAIRGLNLPPDLTMAQDGASLSAAIASQRGRTPPVLDKLDFALAFVSISDPEVSGSVGAKLLLVSTPEELRAITGETSGSGCALSKGRRRKEARTATNAFATPRIVAGREGDVVSFLTWSSAGGVLYRNTVILGRDGVTSARREAVAKHIGVHREPLDPTLVAYVSAPERPAAPAYAPREGR
jgi:hypothetical protein